MSGYTLYWHDYETFGTDPRRDRPAQFAGIRTDADFNIVDEPLVIYCKLADDYLPHPEACLLTGLTPQLVAEKGVCEAKFAAEIYRQMAQAGSCVLGYNTLRFDDEVTRNLFYRNFYDPYAREWQNGNSRWDLIDLVRTARALRPEGIVWPTREDGSPSFKLEHLTAANDIEHSSAHDALADVRASIELAKLLRSIQPKLYKFLFESRSKYAVLDTLKLGSMTPIVHVSGMYPSANGCLAVVLPLCKHPSNNNGILVYDLSADPEPLLSLDTMQIRQRLFTKNAELPTDVSRIPLKTVHVNKCPVVAPVTVLRPQDLERWSIDLEVCRNRAVEIARVDGLGNKLWEVFTQDFEAENDPDLMLYSGGFFGPADKRAMDMIRTTVPERLMDLRPLFNDGRLEEMFFRYRARNYPHTLNASESIRWREFCRQRLGGDFSLYQDALAGLLGRSERENETIEALQDYTQQLQLRLEIEN